MNSSKAAKTFPVAWPIIAMLAFTLVLSVQAADQRVPFYGSFHSAKDPDLPPLPFNPHPELNVIEVEPGLYLVDDTVIPDTPEQLAARQTRQAARERAAAIAADPVLPEAARAAQQAAREAAEAARFQADFAPFLVNDLRKSARTPADLSESSDEQSAQLLNSAAAAGEAYAANYSNALASVQAQGFSPTVTNESGTAGLL